MASSVTAPLERQFGQVPGLQQMTSISSEGQSVITLQFNLSLNIDVAEQEVQQSINASGTYLPADLPTPPLYSKTNPADTPILTLALTSERHCRFPRWRISPTRAWRPRSRSCRAWAWSASAADRSRQCASRRIPAQLASYGINMEDLRSAIIAANVNQAKGNFDGPHQSYQIGANDQLAFERRLRRPGDGLQERRAGQADRRGRRDRQRGKYPRSRVDERDPGRDREHPAAAGRQHHLGGGSASRSCCRSSPRTLPASVQVKILTDRTTTIRASVSDVEFELMLTIGLVVMVIFLFLRNLSATIIPSVAVPLSLVGTFGVMYLLGYSLNNLTLMALTISTGFVVDDAIVMIENIVRYHRRGRTSAARPR